MSGAAVVGLDLSITGTGVCGFDGDTFTIRPQASGDERLPEIRRRVTASLPGMGHPRLVVMEGPVLRSQAAVSLAMLHGVIRAALLDDGLGYVVVPPATLKKYGTGRGNATKPDMAVALYKRTGLELADDNQVDAWWLRCLGLELLGAPPVDLPAANREALGKVSLPEWMRPVGAGSQGAAR